MLDFKKIKEITIIELKEIEELRKLAEEAQRDCELLRNCVSFKMNEEKVLVRTTTDGCKWDYGDYSEYLTHDGDWIHEERGYPPLKIKVTDEGIFECYREGYLAQLAEKYPHSDDEKQCHSTKTSIVFRDFVEYVKKIKH